MDLNRRGVWTFALRYGDKAAIPDIAVELEGLGYSALWVPDVGGPLFDDLDVLLAATESVVIATGILNIWQQTAEATVAWWDGLPEDRRRRVLLGIGVSHASFIGEKWKRPLAAINEFLDVLDDGGIPPEHRCIAALGPKMLAVARERTAGSHPYLVTPENTAFARGELGTGSGLFVEQGVILETDAETARSTARTALDVYFQLPNYTNNWKRVGFTDDDIATRSDALVDALVAWGDVDAIEERVAAHLAAGADHVCIQDLAHAAGGPIPWPTWRALAPS